MKNGSSRYVRQYAEKNENAKKGRGVLSQIYEIFHFPVEEKTSIITHTHCVGMI